MSKRAVKDLLKFQGKQKVKADQEDAYNFVRAHCKIEVDASNPLHWNVLMKAPDGPYVGAVYRLKVVFEVSYPFKCPDISFVDRCLHPNVEESSGKICQDMIGGGANWAPMKSVPLLLAKLLEAFVEPSVDSPINGKMAELFKTDPAKFKQTVQAHIKKDLKTPF